MKRIAFIAIICLSLLLFGFSAALAEETETVTTITCTPGTLLADDDTLNQICETASIRIHSLPSGCGALVLSLGEDDVLTNLLRLEEEGFYLQSDLLGDSPLYFNWEDLSTMFMEQLENNPELAPIKNMMGNGSFQMMMNPPTTAMTLNADTMDCSDKSEALDMMDLDEETMAFATDIEASQMVETGSFSLDGSDVATEKTTVVLSPEDLVRAVELPMVRQQIEQQLVMEAPESTEAEISEQIDAMIDEMKTFITESKLTVTVSMYMTDDEFIAYEFHMKAEDENSGDIYASVTVTKTTIEPAEFYQMKLSVNVDEETYEPLYGSLYLADGFVTGKLLVNSLSEIPVATISFNYDDTDKQHIIGEIDATFYDESVDEYTSGIIVFDQTQGSNVTDIILDLFIGDQIDTMKAALADYSLITLDFHTVTQPDSGFFAALQATDPDSCVQLTKMTDEETETYMMNVQQDMIMVLLSAIDKLPPEISESIMEGFSAED